MELHLKEQVPASLLLLSRALYLPENVPTTDHLQATLSSLPQDMVSPTSSYIKKEISPFSVLQVGEAQIKAAEQEGERVHNKQRLDVLKKEEEKIVQEKAEELKQKQKVNFHN